MTARRRVFLPLLCLYVLTASAGRAEEVAEQEGTKAAPGARPERLTLDQTLKGHQFLQADKKGRLFLLLAESLEVFPLQGDGKLGSPEPLKTGAPDREGLISFGGVSPIGAAMSPGGDWILHEVYLVRLFRGGKEKFVSRPAWAISAVGVIGDDPVISGIPTEFNAAGVKGADLPESAPLFLRWEGDEWEPVATSKLASRAEKDMSRFHEQRSAQLFGSSDGRLWAASTYQHRFREYSAGGKLLTEIVVGKGEATQAENAAQRQKRTAQEAEQLSKEFGRKVLSYEVTAEIVTRAIAEGRDGRMYFLVSGGAKSEGLEMALERYDPATLELQRLPLRMADPGLLTMAAGTDGLYIADWEAKGGIWRLSWEQIEAAEWLPVEDAVVRGTEEQGRATAP